MPINKRLCRVVGCQAIPGRMKTWDKQIFVSWGLPRCAQKTEMDEMIETINETPLGHSRITTES